MCPSASRCAKHCPHLRNCLPQSRQPYLRCKLTNTGESLRIEKSARVIPLFMRTLPPKINVIASRGVPISASILAVTSFMVSLPSTSSVWVPAPTIVTVIGNDVEDGTAAALVALTALAAGRAKGIVLPTLAAAMLPASSTTAGAVVQDRRSVAVNAFDPPQRERTAAPAHALNVADAEPLS